MQIEVERRQFIPTDCTNMVVRYRHTRVLVPIPDEFFTNVNLETVSEHVYAAVTGGGSFMLLGFWDDAQYHYRLRPGD